VLGLLPLKAYAAVVAVAATAFAEVAMAAPAGARSDAEELDAMRANTPHAAQLFVLGEARAREGALAEADERFRRAHAEYPDGSLAWRRDCEVRTALGPRREAILACAEALQRAHSDRTVRALVSALVDGPEAPTEVDLVQALAVIAKEHDNPLGQVTAAAAACDVAERTGEGAMLQQCAGELERLAPNDPATQKARAALAMRCPPWRFWGGWGAIAALLGVTLADWLRTSFRRRAARVSVVAAASLVIVLGIPRVAHAEPEDATRAGVSKWAVDPQSPEAAIPSEKDRNADPLQFGYWLQDVASLAERASKQGDHATAARLYVALAKAVPDRAVGDVKACAEYEAMGQLDAAIAACGDALLRDGSTVGDYERFVELMLSKPGDLSGKEAAALGQVLVHLREDAAGRGVVDDLECQVGARTSNVAQLHECTAALAAREPDGTKTITYLWALAVAEGRFADAKALEERARAAGVAPESVGRMARAAAVGQSDRVRQRAFLVAALVLLSGALMIAARALLARRRSLVTARTS
jgi:tetratricopeptide (TPR) repeat protein